MNATITRTANRCPRCQAAAGYPCRTRSGSIAARLHIGRAIELPELGDVVSIDDPRVTTDPAELAVLRARAAALDALPTDDEPEPVDCVNPDHDTRALCVSCKTTRVNPPRVTCASCEMGTGLTTEQAAARYGVCVWDGLPQRPGHWAMPLHRNTIESDHAEALAADATGCEVR